MGIEIGSKICYQLFMSNVIKVSVALTPELNELVKNAVVSGQYASASEVVREALRDWEQKQEGRQLVDSEIKRLWDEGLASGPSRFSNMSEIIAESKRRSAFRKTG